MVELSEKAIKKIADVLNEIGEYDGIDFIGKYKGNDIFVTSFEDKTNIPIIGYPTYFVVNGDSVRTVDYGEAEFDIFENM